MQPDVAPCDSRPRSARLLQIGEVAERCLAVRRERGSGAEATVRFLSFRGPRVSASLRGPGLLDPSETTKPHQGSVNALPGSGPAIRAAHAKLNIPKGLTALGYPRELTAW